jgi:hypothetical protein
MLNTSISYNGYLAEIPLEYLESMEVHSVVHEI